MSGATLRKLFWNLSKFALSFAIGFYGPSLINLITAYFGKTSNLVSEDPVTKIMLAVVTLLITQIYEDHIHDKESSDKLAGTVKKAIEDEGKTLRTQLQGDIRSTLVQEFDDSAMKLVVHYAKDDIITLRSLNEAIKQLLGSASRGTPILRPVLANLISSRLPGFLEGIERNFKSTVDLTLKEQCDISEMLALQSNTYRVVELFPGDDPESWHMPWRLLVKRLSAYKAVNKSYYMVVDETESPENATQLLMRYEQYFVDLGFSFFVCSRANIIAALADGDFRFNAIEIYGGIACISNVPSGSETVNGYLPCRYYDFRGSDIERNLVDTVVRYRETAEEFISRLRGGLPSNTTAASPVRAR